MWLKIATVLRHMIVIALLFYMFVAALLAAANFQPIVRRLDTLAVFDAKECRHDHHK